VHIREEYEQLDRGCGRNLKHSILKIPVFSPRKIGFFDTRRAFHARYESIAGDHELSAAANRRTNIGSGSPAGRKERLNVGAVSDKIAGTDGWEETKSRQEGP
jgi:hypothetical protein